MTADITAIREALADQITKVTGLRAQGVALDQINPPTAVVLPGQPVITYGTTMEQDVTVNLRVLVAVSDAYTPDAQKALDVYLGTGAQSILAAVKADDTLGGTVMFAVVISAGNYGRIEYAGQVYFGARVDVQAGVM